MRSSRLAAPWCLALALVGLGYGSGCAALPVLQHVARPETVTVSPPGEDGTRYIAVEGGPTASARSVHRRFKLTANQACDGDYMLLSDSGYAQREAGVIRRRLHEGYVRCVMPEQTELSPTPDAPTAADAEAATPERKRRGRRSSTRSGILGQRSRRATKRPSRGKKLSARPLR